MSFEIKTVDVSGAETEYMKFGRGGKNLVIIPGLSITPVLDSAEAIEGAYSCFADEYTVYLFDRRKNIPEGYDIYQMAKDTALAVKSAGIEKGDFFGVSQGGMISLSIAVFYPELIGKLVLGSTAARLGEKSERIVNGWISLAKEHRIKELFAAFAEAVYSEEFYQKYSELILSAAASVTNDNINKFIAAASATGGFDIYDKLEKIKCPVFGIGAAKDKIFGAEHSNELAEKLGCEKYIYKEYGHAAYDEAADYKERVLAFLRRG